ncbi:MULTISPECIES: nucleotidyl transferase AbiEii/AbiGii toxin family protein [Nocardiopsis]|uniref:Nucleotidyl transferase AbiEii/AbiGii toxin family protein n=1 Tax=Nocardiopsis lambiniae TaxID=3075539 RepID=A0ABU2M3C7_9ACTN|nr:MULTISPECIES: nucleotidyl transferase AbiEii/AbiGii toxin family protein [unclassified Nocardiopsis]MDE3722488.1 nucleotidyl transferase AbiEii/AbiGii toxin family protein [Nocardiopsis sp. N85]MDT0327149.1 nucleotidyl transferase AbiEii/AbiGii toxin family protein [Nocardiopsis sp. DSM 44743]
MTLPYKTPAAFRRALTDRLRSQAHPHGPWPLSELQRQFAYDRLLARLYLVDNDWIVKGATALLARELAVRRTVDIDIYRNTGREAAEHDLRAASAQDLGDWFRFETGRSTPISDGANGVRVPVTSRLGTTVWTKFHVDVVAENIRMTGIAEDVPPLPPLDVPGLERSGYRVYPLVDHIADKTCAILERHGPEQRPSTRFKDLVDLVSVVSRTPLPADEQRHALYSEAERRGLALPRRFSVPDRGLWEPGYAAEAGRALALPAGALDQALALTEPFLDPLLNRTAAGTWNPHTTSWESST